MSIGVIATTGRFIVKNTSYTDTSSFVNAMFGAQLVYELAMPTTYQLTPVEIATLLGTNNIWADTGDTAVDYCADTKGYVDGAIPSVPVQDVKVNGTSVLSNGAAEIPLGSGSNFGVVKLGDGLQTVSNAVVLNPATAAGTKSGSSNRFPIVPANQHSAAFYGLAKAAGDSTQSASSNAVGVYTDSAKDSIRKMLGTVADEAIAPIEDDESANRSYSVGSLFIRNGRLYKVTTAITQDGAIITTGTGKNCEEITITNEFVRTSDISSSGVTDVKINNSTIVTNGVANIPLGSDSNVGLVKTGASDGIYTLLDGSLVLNTAGSNDIKAGYNSELPLTPSTQHDAVFYGLAKAAGDSSQSSSVNGVGEYTLNAKESIRKMLGVVSDEAIAPLEEDNYADDDYNIGDLFIHNGNLYKATLSIVLGDEIIEGYNCELANIVEEFARINDTAATGVTDVEVDGVSVVSNGVAEIHIPVQEVLINNTTSIMSNGTANIPLATTSRVGVVKGGNAYGTNIQSDGTVSIYKATDANVKDGTNTLRPITPSNQHQAAFYGLAKAAGDTTQSESFNNVGTYTENAKNKIRAMIDAAAAEAIAPSENTGNSSTYYDTNDFITVNGKLYKVTSDISPDGAIITEGNGQNCTETKIIDVFVKKTDWASNYGPGIVMADGNRGIEVGYATSNLQIVPALTSDITAQEDNYKPITSFTVKPAVFYGLAQAAGDMTQVLSGNDIGTYTSQAKAAIQSMLDVPSTGDLSDYAEKTDTVLETTLSRGRKANTTVGTGSIAFGNTVEASGDYSFATGRNTVASGSCSKAEGSSAVASGSNSHAEGYNTIANGTYTHAEGRLNVEPVIFQEWVADTHYYVGDGVYHEPVFYVCTEENTDATWTASHWRQYPSSSNTAFVIGNGNSTRSNAYMVDWDGNGHYMGDVYVGANADSTGGTKLAKVSDIAVNDVQIAGTSILSNGVANIPVATGSVSGVVKVWTGDGLRMKNGSVLVDGAGADLIKAGTEQYRPLVPNGQHYAAFYGLAKAAGADMAASSNAIGTYTSEAKAAIKTMLGVSDPTVTDVQVDGTSILNNGVANLPIVDEYTPLVPGLVAVKANRGILASNGVLWVTQATDAAIKAGTEEYSPITPNRQSKSVFYGLAKAAGDSTQSASSNAVGTYTAAAKTAIRNMLGVTDGSIYTETVSGTTPSITGEPNVRYICGEISTLTITPPSAGSIIVRFRSGTSATVLTAQGVNWPAWFDPTSLETSTTYEIMITDGIYGSVMLWPV